MRDEMQAVGLWPRTHGVKSGCMVCLAVSSDPHMPCSCCGDCQPRVTASKWIISPANKAFCHSQVEGGFPVPPWNTGLLARRWARGSLLGLAQRVVWCLRGIVSSIMRLIHIQSCSDAARGGIGLVQLSSIEACGKNQRSEVRVAAVIHDSEIGWHSSRS